MPDEIQPLPPLPQPPHSVLRPGSFNSDSDATFGALPDVVSAYNANVPIFNAAAAAAVNSASTAAGQAQTATQQAVAAGQSASTATQKAADATSSATNAAASELAASKLNLGDKSTPPTTDNQGQLLRAGATYYDTSLSKWRVWTGSAWGDGISAVAGVSSVNGQTGDVAVNQINDAELSMSKTWSSAKIATDRQAKLVDGQNIKTINNTPITGSGNLLISTGAGEDGSTLLSGLIKQTAAGVVPTTLSGTATYLNGVLELDADRTLLLIGKESGLWGVVYSDASGFGIPVLIRSGDLRNVARAIQHSETEVLVVSCPVGSTSVHAVILTVTGSAIAVNTAASVTSGFTSTNEGFGNFYEGNWGFVKVGSTYCVGRFAAGNTPEIITITIIGTTCAASKITISSATAYACPVLYESGGYLVVFLPRANTTAAYYLSYSVSGTTLTSVTALTPVSGYENSTISKMASNTFLIVQGASSAPVRSRTLTVSTNGSLSLTAEAIVLQTNGVGDPAPRVVRLSDTKAAVCGNYPSANVVTVAENSCTVGTQIDLPGGSSGVYPLTSKSGIAYFAHAYGVVRVVDNSGQPNATNETVSFSPIGSSQAASVHAFDRPPNSVLVGSNFFTSLGVNSSLIFAVSEKLLGLTANGARTDYTRAACVPNNKSLWFAQPATNTLTRLVRLTIV